MQTSTYVNNDEEDQETPAYLLSPTQCIEAAKNSAELLKSLPKDDPSYSEIFERSKLIKTSLQEFINTQVGNLDEAVTMQLFQQFDDQIKRLDMKIKSENYGDLDTTSKNISDMKICLQSASKTLDDIDKEFFNLSNEKTKRARAKNQSCKI